MAQSFQTSQFFAIKPSRRLKRVVDLLHLLALLACGLNSLPVIYRSVLFVIVAVLWLLSKQYWKTATSLLRYTKSNGWEMAFGGNDYVRGEVLTGTVITGWGIFLQFKPDRQSTVSLIIPNDALSADDFRHLMVRLTLSGYERN